MNRRELPHVQARLDFLRGQALTSVGYAADMLTMTFGLDVREYSLHIQCSYRMATEDAILFDRMDYFCPSDAQRARWCSDGLDESDFPDEWPDEERRLFEQVKLLPLNGMTVAEVGVNRLGDLTLRFANGMTLLALPMASDDRECWRFWCDARWPDQHMVVYGDHVELHGPGEAWSPICE